MQKPLLSAEEILEKNIVPGRSYATAAIKAMQEFASQYQQDNDRLKEELKEAEGQIEFLDRENDRLRESLSITKDSAHRLIDEVETLKARIQTMYDKDDMLDAWGAMANYDSFDSFMKTKKPPTV